MQFNEMSELDLKLSLLSGNSIKIDNLVIKPYKLKEIERYGYSKYQKNLKWILISIDDFINNIKDEEKRKIAETHRESLKTFDFYIRLGGEEIRKSLLESLSMIFRTDDLVILPNGSHSVIALDLIKTGAIEVNNETGEMKINRKKLDELDENDMKLVDRDNFDDIVNIVKLQNYLEKPDSKISEENPIDEETRLLQEHMRKMREKVENIKKNQQESEGIDQDIDVSDIISAVSSKSNSINKLNVWYLTLYQLYHEYARLELIDNYDLSVRAMLAGAKKVDLTHWSSKI